MIFRSTVASLAVARGVFLAASGQAQPAPQQHEPANPPQGSATASPHTVHPRQQRHAGDWLRKYKDLPADQQDKALDNDPDFRRLPPTRQAQLRERLHHFASLPLQNQQRILKRMETWEHLTATQKQQAKNVFLKIQKLPPPRRREMMAAIHDLRQMTPEQRQQAVDSEAYHSRFSDQERELLKGVVRLPLAPLNAQKRDEAPESAPQ